MFYSAPPPVYVTVQTSGPPVWLPILSIVISALALVISSLQFLNNRKQLARDYPRMSLSGVFTENYILGSHGHRVVAIGVSNTGASETYLTSCEVYTHKAMINGLNCLLGDNGERQVRGGDEEYIRRIPAHTTMNVTIDMSLVDAETQEAAVFISFGHGEAFSINLEKDKLGAEARKLKRTESRRWPDYRRGRQAGLWQGALSSARTFTRGTFKAKGSSGTVTSSTRRSEPPHDS